MQRTVTQDVIVPKSTECYWDVNPILCIAASFPKTPSQHPATAATTSDSACLYYFVVSGVVRMQWAVTQPVYIFRCQRNSVHAVASDSASMYYFVVSGMVCMQRTVTQPVLFTQRSGVHAADSDSASMYYFVVSGVV